MAAQAASQQSLLPPPKTAAPGTSPAFLQVPQVTIQTPTPLASPVTAVRKMSFTDLYGLLRKRPKLTLQLPAARGSHMPQMSVATPAVETPAGAGGPSSDANTVQPAAGGGAFGCYSCGKRFMMKPKSSFMLTWLGLVSLATLYNLWTTIAREAFRNIVDGYLVVWISCDALADIIYILDIVVQTRTGFYEKAGG